MSGKDLDGRAFVVIGGTTGLGLSGAKACLDAGARVVVLGRNRGSVERAQTNLGGNAVAIAGDATDPEAASSAIQVCREAFGRFDGLYHVAGGSGRSKGDGPLHEVSDEGWQATIDLNLNSLFYSNRAAVRALLDASTPGVILNMSSVLGISPSPEHFSTHAYAAAKSAVLGFTRACASHYADRSIRFNVIAPALVETPMSRRAMEDEEIVQFIRRKQPLDGGRASEPKDLDAAVVFLLSDGAKLITGQWLNVDGGWTVSEGREGTR